MSPIEAYGLSWYGTPAVAAPQTQAWRPRRRAAARPHRPRQAADGHHPDAHVEGCFQVRLGTRPSGQESEDRRGPPRGPVDAHFASGRHHTCKVGQAAAGDVAQPVDLGRFEQRQAIAA